MPSYLTTDPTAFRLNGVTFVIRPCSHCGKDATVRSGNLKTQKAFYCSVECRTIGMSERFNKRAACTCLECGEVFRIPACWIKRGNGRFCSVACYAKWQQKFPHTSRGEVAIPKKMTTCARCGKEHWERKQSKWKSYCSQRCQNIATRVTKTCPICSKTFTAPTNRRSRRYCSALCRMVAEREWLDFTCESCGKPFRAQEFRKHCSETCRRPPVFVACLNCQKEFRVVPSMAKSMAGNANRQATRGRRFCSPRCYRCYTGETEPETNVRHCLIALGIGFHQEYVVSGWRYPVDFFIPSLNTMLEVDEPYWHNRGRGSDERKTRFLVSRGYVVVRLNAKPFYGPITDVMIDLLRSSINANGTGSTGSRQPIQLSFAV